MTAVFTGLGAVPFFFIKSVSKRFIGFGNAMAAGLMLGASIGLVWEAVDLSVVRTLIGLVLGVVLVLVTGYLLPDGDDGHAPGVAELSNANLRKILMVMAIMTAHSFAEGIGVGVSFGGREGFGELISAAIAIHNIPEGIAIALVMIPRGVSTIRAGLWAIFSSLPQPLMAVPAFLFVQEFAPTLPIGLALAAGAMFYMVFAELLPEAFENVSKLEVGAVCLVSCAAMLGFQWLL
jgi:zinc transporter ZupT